MSTEEFARREINEVFQNTTNQLVDQIQSTKTDFESWIWSDGTVMEKSKPRNTNLTMEFTRNDPPPLKRESPIDNLCRTTNNPFFAKNNYVDDITTQQQFLIPKNSSLEKE